MSLPPAEEPEAPASIVAPRAPLKRPAPVEQVDDFEGELKLLAAGRAAIQRGALAEGLALLKRHKQKFPRGHFAQERDALLAIARCEAGQAGAIEAGRNFIKSSPDSIHADRVRTSCKL